MNEQTSLPPEGEREYPTTCAWCESGGAAPYELEPAKRGTDKRTGLPVIRKAAIMAPACPTCAARFDAAKATADDDG